MSQPFTPTQTDQDRAEVAKFKAMLAERRGKDRTWCIGYGKAVALHLERKELPKGQTNPDFPHESAINKVENINGVDYK
jgi:hypothetical protein